MYLRHDALEVLLEAEDELLEGEVDGLGEDVLRLQRERRHVPVRLEEVEQLRRVGHPEGEPGGQQTLLVFLTIKKPEGRFLVGGQIGFEAQSDFAPK